MDIGVEKAESVWEALEKADERWLTYYYEIKRTRSASFLLWKPQTRLFDKIFWSAGSIINLFPNTHYEADDFRCWRASMNDAWNDDWYNVGADLYKALSKAQVEPIDVQSAEDKPTFSAIKP